jgi:hypothetical protein
MKTVPINKQIRNDFLEIRLSLAISDNYITSLLQFVTILSEDEKQQFNKYLLLWKMRLAFWHLAILELCKLFKEGESNSLLCFMNSLINNYKRIIWKENIDLGELKNLKSIIESSNEKFLKIQNYRDTVVAHSDRTKPSQQLYIDDLITLLDNAKNIYERINHSLNSAMTEWEFINDDHDMALIKNINKYNKIREIVTIADIKNESTMKTKTLIDIIG